MDHHRGPVGAAVGPLGGVGLGAEDRAVPRGPRPEIVEGFRPVLPGDLDGEVGHVRDDLGGERGALRERPVEPRGVGAGDDQAGDTRGRVGHRQVQAHDLAPEGAKDVPERRDADPARVVGADGPVGGVGVDELVDAVGRRGAARGERGPGDRRDHRLGGPEGAEGRPAPERGEVGQEPPVEPWTQHRHRPTVEPEEHDPRRESWHARVASRSPRPSPPIPRRKRLPWRQGRPRMNEWDRTSGLWEATPSGDPGQSRVFHQAAWQAFPILWLVVSHGRVRDRCRPGEVEGR